MASEEIKSGIFWVGAVDWDIRDFHGYSTPLGSSYNAYLVIDEKVALIDTVKEHLSEEMLYRISRIIDPAKIDYVISNHVEMDHSGSIPKIMEMAPRAKIIASKNGEKGLKRHFKKDWDFQVANSGDSLDIGKRKLVFVNTPMVHWPDSMVSYMPEEKILFSNDAFGQHLASFERYDVQIGWSALKKEAAKYYSNIVLPYGKQVVKALDALSSLDIEIICPSHGVMWKDFIPDILKEYAKWANHQTKNKALIVYDSMWKSTEKIACSLEFGLAEAGVPATRRNLKTTHISDVMTDLLTSGIVLLGSPTLNNGMMPSMGSFLTYVKGLRPKNRTALAFGSHGWGGQGVKQIEQAIEELKWETPIKSVAINYIPDKEQLDETQDVGKRLGNFVLNN